MQKLDGESYLKEVSLLIFFFPYAWSILLCLLFKFNLLSCLYREPSGFFKGFREVLRGNLKE